MRARATSRRSYFLAASAYARESRMLKLRSKCRNIHSSFNLFCNGRRGGKSLIMRTAASPNPSRKGKCKPRWARRPGKRRGLLTMLFTEQCDEGLQSPAWSQPQGPGGQQAFHRFGHSLLLPPPLTGLKLQKVPRGREGHPRQGHVAPSWAGFAGGQSARRTTEHV